MSRSASNTSNCATVGDTGTGDNTNSGTNNTRLRGETAGPDTRTLPDPSPRSRRHADKHLSSYTALQREGASGTAFEPTIHMTANTPGLSS